MAYRTYLRKTLNWHLERLDFSQFKYINYFQNARGCNPVFAKFIENQETRPEVQNKLSALLITPIQRVPRYKLLLNQLYELTTPTDKDYTLLKGKSYCNQEQIIVKAISLTIIFFNVLLTLAIEIKITEHLTFRTYIKNAIYIILNFLLICLIVDCMKKIEEAALHINKVIEEQENAQRLLELQRYLRGGEPNIITPGK